MALERRMRFVPPMIFASTVAGVVPACGDDGKRGMVIALAVAGFTGCVPKDAGSDASGGTGGTGNPCGTGGTVIITPGGQSNTGGGGTGGGIIVLAIAGFARGTGG